MNIHRPASRQSNYGAHRTSVQSQSATKLRTSSMNPDDALSANSQPVLTDEGDTMNEEDPRHAEFRERFAKTEARIAALLGGAEDISFGSGADDESDAPAASGDRAEPQAQAAAPKKPARTIDEDDYGDDDEDDEADEVPIAESPLQTKSTSGIIGSSHLKIPSIAIKPTIDRTASTSSAEQAKNAEDVRKELNEAKKAAEDAARRSFHTLFYTLETDRDAMLEQQKLDELDRQVETEMSGQAANNAGNAAGGVNQQQGSLSSANLGSSSLTFKHLIARIDAKRNMVKASDAQLRSLMSDVRKNRSKWASEDKVGQEELYEAAEKVLMELKAMTEHAAPFLQRVNKRDAPDYYQVIKQPMDIGTMIKKLKSLQYKSKKEFVDDLNLIWSNCLKYNADPAHFLRKKALYMRKETEKLVPLIPEITVRDRAEVEAEERRLQSIDADLEGVEESDDEEPIMASRGRKAPSKGNKGSSTARKAPSAGPEGTPGAETKPLPSIAGASIPRTEFLRADSEARTEQNGFATPPPPGTLTPLGPNGVMSAAGASQADASDIEGGSSTIGTGQSEDPDFDDAEYKTWKQVTKKDRAIIATERHRLFRGDHLNVEEPALCRTKAGMRRWLRQHKAALEETFAEEAAETVDGKDGEQPATGETLAEGIEGEEEERQVPDYYDVLTHIPDLNERLRWAEDAEGQVIQQGEEFLRMVPKGYFNSPKSNLASKMEGNMKQMQDTRKICAKIGIVKQMQLQSQMYQNQFQKYDPQPFEEADVGDIVVSDEGAIMSQWTCRAALQRSVGKIFYHAGFEEFQPSALDAVTDIAGNFFSQLAHTLNVYREAPKIKADPIPATTDGSEWKPRFTNEEMVLHCLRQNGVDLEALEGYVKEDVERLSSKLGVMHERMKSHLADLLRPALDSNAGPDGAGAFHDDSEQFTSGDFAEEIGEDFFGFRDLGLDKELASFAVPFHLLKSRLNNAYQAQNANAATSAGNVWEAPPPYEPVTIHTVRNQIGLVQSWFLEKLHVNGNEPLVEDEDLPAKQRFPKPRLPPTGKISSPRKRPLREQQMMAKKKRKLEEANSQEQSQSQGANKGIPKPVGKLKLEPSMSKENLAEPEKDDMPVGMMSPESINGAA